MTLTSRSTAEESAQNNGGIDADAEHDDEYVADVADAAEEEEDGDDDDRGAKMTCSAVLGKYEGGGGSSMMANGFGNSATLSLELATSEASVAVLPVIAEGGSGHHNSSLPTFSLHLAQSGR